MDKYSNKKIALITGSSSGIGFLTTLNFARKGYITYASTRKIDSEKIKGLQEISKKENIVIKPIYLDLNNQDSIEDAVKKITEESGVIDVLINNAGYGYYSTVEDTDIKEFSKQFETNVVGTLKTMKAVIPHMRRQGNGLIINISSIMGFSTAPLNATYSSSKYALECISETAAIELKPLGIDVVIVEPGDFHTDFIKNSKRHSYQQDSPYLKLYTRMASKSTNKVVTKKDPQIVADMLLKISENKKRKLRYMIGREVLVRKLLHTILFDNLWIKFLRFFYKW